MENGCIFKQMRLFFSCSEKRKRGGKGNKMGKIEENLRNHVLKGNILSDKVFCLDFLAKIANGRALCYNKKECGKARG